jgi:CcmD family protein
VKPKGKTMFGLDHNAVYVASALGITWLTLGLYLMYLRSRLRGLVRQLT